MSQKQEANKLRSSSTTVKFGQNIKRFFHAADETRRWAINWESSDYYVWQQPWVSNRFSRPNATSFAVLKVRCASTAVTMETRSKNKVTIIWAPQSGTSAEGANCTVRDPQARAVGGGFDLGVCRSVVSSPSGVRGTAPAASDFLVYRLYRWNLA